jgi:hypothetical protein
VLDNHTVKLGTQGFILFCRIARKREGETALYAISREFYINSRVTLVGKKYSADTKLKLCTWRHNVINYPSRRTCAISFLLAEYLVLFENPHGIKLFDGSLEKKFIQHFRNSWV